MLSTFQCSRWKNSRHGHFWSNDLTQGYKSIWFSILILQILKNQYWYWYCLSNILLEQYIAKQYIAKYWYCSSNILPEIEALIFVKYGSKLIFLIPKISNYTNTDSDLTFSVNRTRKIKNLEKSSRKFSHRPKSEQYIAWFRQYIARNWQYIAQNWQYIARSIYWQYIARKVQYWYWYCNFWKTNIDIDIANINILLQYIAQQYIDLYPWGILCAN